MPDEEKQLTTTETQEPERRQEIVNQQETPEQKAQREFQENVQRVLLRLEEYLATIKAQEELHEDLGKILEQDISIETPPARTLQSIKEEMSVKDHTLKSLRDEMKKLALRARGVKNFQDLSPFVYYVETYLQRIDSKYVRVETAQLEKKITEYESQGYRVVGEDRGEENTYLTLHKRIPYKVPLRHIKRLSGCLNQGSDPIELLERFQHFGFEIDERILHWQLDYVKKFTSASWANEVLRKIDAAGIKSQKRYFGTFPIEGPDPFLEFIEDEQTGNLLTPETIKRIKNFEQHFGKAIEISDTVSLKDVAQTFSNPDCLELLTFIVSQNDLQFNNADPYSILRRMSALQRAGVVSELTAIAKKSPLLGKRVCESSLSNFYSIEQVKTDFESSASSESIKKLLEDEKLLDVVSTFISALSVKESDISPNSFAKLISELEKSKENPNALVLLQLAKEWELPLGSNRYGSWEPELRDFVYILEKADVLKILVKPEFQEFVKSLKEVFDYNLSWYSLIDVADDLYNVKGSYGHRWLLSWFYDDKFRERLNDQDFQEAVAHFSKMVEFNGSENAGFYRRLSDIPQYLEIVRNLENQFGYHLKKDDCATFLEFFAPYNERRASLFDQKTVRYYQQLKATTGYEFTMKDAEVLSYQAQDGSFTKLLLNPEALVAVKALLPLGLSNLYGLKELDAKGFALVPILLQEFSLNPNYDFFQSILPYVGEHQEVVLPTIRRLKECGFMVNMTSQLEKVNEVGEYRLISFQHLTQHSGREAPKMIR